MQPQTFREPLFRPLFPEHYRASRDQLVRDWVLFGAVIVGTIVLAAWINLIVIESLPPAP